MPGGCGVVAAAEVIIEVLAGRLAAARETAPQDRRREQVHELILARPSISRAAWMISRGQSRAPRAATVRPVVQPDQHV
jgi:hypothetical protein